MMLFSLILALGFFIPVCVPAEYRLQELPDSDGVPGLYVGSGLAFKANCVNVDVEGITDMSGQRTRPGALFGLMRIGEALSETEPSIIYFLQHDGTKDFPFAEHRFEWILAEHFIEHISFDEAVRFLREAKRMLAPGGTMRLSTPDLRLYVSAYLDPKMTFFKSHHALMTTGEMEGKNRHLRLSPADMLNHIFYNFGHRHIYDIEEIQEIVRIAGWTAEEGCQVHRASFRQSDVNVNLAQLDDEIHEDESMYIDLYCR